MGIGARFLTIDRNQRRLDVGVEDLFLDLRVHAERNGATALLLYYFDTAGLEHPIDVSRVRDIAAGEEITYDYMINTHGGASWTCACGAPGCRGRTVASFFELAPALQRAYARYLAPWFVAAHFERVAPAAAHAAERTSAPLPAIRCRAHR